MANNPLQQYFRQPKIYISLPSQGLYNKPGTIQGDPTRLPVFGMTGMDEIMMKTPDALLTGESTAKVINSCCPSITDPWDLSNLDTDLVLAAIRIATYSNELQLADKCKKCGTDNEYSMDLNRLMDHYAQCQYDNTVVLQELKIIIRPLNYKQSTEFSTKNFQLQQQLNQSILLEDEVEKKTIMNDIFQKLATIRNEVFALGIESIDTGKQVVTERAFIEEFIANADSSVMSTIGKQIEKNQRTWTSPLQTVRCGHCDAEATLSIELDQSNFFVTA
jgi:hypothetical protein